LYDWGRFYETGDGDPMDLVTACKRFPKALAAGFSTAFRGVGRGLAPTDVVVGNCQMCRNTRHIKYVVFHRNVGMLVQRQTHSIKASLCRSCLHNVFLEYTYKNLLLGWWGMISLVVTPIFFLMNLCVYIAAWYRLRNALE
jgi:hypothetical protein